MGSVAISQPRVPGFIMSLGYGRCGVLVHSVLSLLGWFSPRFFSPFKIVPVGELAKESWFLDVSVCLSASTHRP